MAAARQLVTIKLFALTVLLLPAALLVQVVSSRRPFVNPFLIYGSIYCDTCRCGFETTASTPIPGATVRLECRDRDSLANVYSYNAVTDSKGKYSILVDDDHHDQICRSVLVSSPLGHCKEPDPGRSSATLILTRSNGVVNSKHQANSMGFFRHKRLDMCPKLLETYLLEDSRLTN